MDILLNKFTSKVNSVLTGFDRIIFKGIIRPIVHAAGMESFLVARKILNKDFKTYAMAQSQEIVECADRIAHSKCGNDVIYVFFVSME